MYVGQYKHTHRKLYHLFIKIVNRKLISNKMGIDKRKIRKTYAIGRKKI